MQFLLLLPPRFPLTHTPRPGCEEPTPGACAACRDLSAEPLPEAGLEAPAALAAVLSRRIAGELALDGCWDEKPLLAGGEVLAALGLAKAGPELGAWCDALLTWQLSHPGAGKAEARAWLEAHKGAAAPPAPEDS